MKRYEVCAHLILTRTSGTGDHGEAGIRDAIESHVCNVLCKSMDLASKEQLKEALDQRIREAEIESKFNISQIKSDAELITFIRRASPRVQLVNLDRFQGC